MQKNRWFIKGAVFLAAMIVMGGTKTLTAEAGLNETVRNASSFTEGIDSTEWHDANKDVEAKDGVITFPNTSIEETKLVAKTPAKWDESLKTLVKVEGDYSFTSLSEGQKFILGMGLSSIEGAPGDPGNIEIAFENNGGLAVSVTAYTEDGETVTLAEQTKAGSMNNTHVSAEITGDSKLIVSVAGKQIYSGELPMTGEGRIGFLQTGGCGVVIRNLNAATYQYDRPQNSNILEDFEQGGFNKNVLMSKMVYRPYTDDAAILGIEEMDGNHVFRFYMHNSGYLGTMMEYSNFEMSFDVPYMARQSEIDDEGNTVEEANGQFLVAFGGESYTFTNYGYETGAEYIVFREINAFATQSGVEAAMPESHQVYSAPNDKGWSAKIRVVDGTVTVYLKWMEETTWTEALSYELPTPTGYISIWQGNNMAIDNLSITNLDDDPDLIEMPFESSLVEVPEDYEYEPMEKVYETVEEKEEGFSWLLLIPITAGVCVVGLGVLVLVVKVKGKKKRRKAGGQDES